MEKTNKFDWQDFYSEANANIVEEILDKKITAPEELFNLLFPVSGLDLSNLIYKNINTLEDLIEYLNQKFKKWHNELLPKIERGELTHCPYSEILANASEIVDEIKRKFPEEAGTNAWNLRILTKFNEPITPDTFLNSDQTLALLIRDGLLPLKLCRLPRLKRTDSTIPDYYQQHSEKHTAHELQEIIKSPANFKKTPITLEYEELLRLLEKHGRLKSEIEIACKEGKLGAYIRVGEDDVKTECLSKYAFQSVEYLRKLNCGNPAYKKRYEGLERLFIEKEDSNMYREESNLCLQNLWHSGSSNLLFKTSKTSLIDGNYLQSTDLETKFHIKRTLKSFNGKLEIRTTDLIFIKDEVDIFLEENNSTSRQTTNQYFKALNTLLQIGEDMERHPNTYIGKNENALRDTIILALKREFDSVTGETYNKRGKTDILITHEKKIICIAECKFWDGAALHHQTIDQILNYLTSLDAATIIYFSQNKNFGPILNEIDAVTSQHPCFKSNEGKTHDRWFNYHFCLADDKTIAIKLAILLFNFNETKNHSKARITE